MGKKAWVIPVVLSAGALAYGIVATARLQNDVYWMPIGIVGLTFTIVWFTIFGPMLRNRRIMRTGEPGTAKVLRMFETGVTVNNNPMVKLEVEVTPARGSSYVTMTKVLVSRLNPMVYGPGTIVSVKIDPKDQMQVVIDSEATAVNRGLGGAGGFSAASSQVNAQRNAAMTALLEASDKIRKEVLDSPTSREAQGTILSSWSLDVTVNDMAVGMEFLVEAQIPGRAPFTVEIKGVVSHASVQKYQIGTKVRLKYDPADPEKRITIAGVL